MGLCRQEYWNGLPYPPPGNLPDPGIKLASLLSPTDGFFTTSATWEASGFWWYLHIKGDLEFPGEIVDPCGLIQT